MSKLLTDAGRALYGDRWQSPLSRDLGVSDREVRRWVAGDVVVPRGVYTDLLRMVIDRAQDLDDLVEPLKQAG
jgi:hypothetical protein